MRLSLTLGGLPPSRRKLDLGKCSFDNFEARPRPPRLFELGAFAPKPLIPGTFMLGVFELGRF